jgi:regulatory protein
MSFSDRRTPPPAWAVEPGEAEYVHERVLPAAPGGTVISMRTRRRVPPPQDPQADPRTRGAEPDPHDWAREIVLRMLTASPKSRSQLADGLRRKDCPDDVAAEVLDRLEDVGLIDDASFATDFVRNQQSAMGLSGRALAQRLRAKGVDAETARSALDALDPSLEEDQARRLVARKLRSMQGLDAIVQTRRLAGMLARKGYGPELSMRVIREAIALAPEHQRD